MARFRIVQRPSHCNPTEARFDIERKEWWWWEFVTFEWSLANAEKRICEIQGNIKDTVETKVIKEYVL
jgi:hypothetical protein